MMLDFVFGLGIADVSAVTEAGRHFPVAFVAVLVLGLSQPSRLVRLPGTTRSDRRVGRIKNAPILCPKSINRKILELAPLNPKFCFLDIAPRRLAIASEEIFTIPGAIA